MAGGKGKSVGGKASGAKDSGTKTQKSHSAKAGLQVSHFYTVRGHSEFERERATSIILCDTTRHAAHSVAELE